MDRWTGHPDIIEIMLKMASYINICFHSKGLGGGEIFYFNKITYSISRSDAYSPVSFEYDNKILEDYTGTLVADKLAVNDFTAESLTHL